VGIPDTVLAPHEQRVEQFIPYVEVRQGDVTIPLLDLIECDEDSESGWIWLVEGERIALCGDSCVQARSGTPITGQYGCIYPE
jgi:hypothetical protein